MESLPLWHTTRDGICDRCGYSIQTPEAGDVRLVYTQHRVKTCYESAGNYSCTKVKPFCPISHDEETGEAEVTVQYSDTRESGAYLWFEAFFINEEGEKYCAGRKQHIDYYGSSKATCAFDRTATLPAGTWMLMIDDYNFK